MNKKSFPKLDPSDAQSETDYRKRPLESPPKTKALISSMVDDLVSSLNYLMLRPFADIGSVWNHFTRSGDTQSAIAAAEAADGYYEDPNANQPKRSWWLLAILWFPVSIVLAILSMLVKLVISPVELIVGLSTGASNASRTSIIVSAVLSVILGAAVWFGLEYKHHLDAIHAQRIQMADAFVDGNYDQVIEGYRSLAEQRVRLEPAETFRFAQSLMEVGQLDVARQWVDRLAPPEGELRGFPKAHQLKAISIAATMPRPVDESTLRSLRWHLESADQPVEPDHHFAWAQYFMSIQDNISALGHLEKAAPTRPELNLIIAAIHQNLNQSAKFRARIKLAEGHFRKEVEKAPDDPNPRITLSQILFTQGKLRESERVILGGPKTEAKLKSARAEHFLNRYVNLTAGNPEYLKLEDSDTSTEARFKLIKRALAQDLNHLSTYHHLIRFYRNTDDKKSDVMSTLQQTIKTDDDAGLAYFALSNIMWSNEEYEQARQHMETAFEISPKEMVVVANNLAWILTEAEPPELDRAYELSKRAVQARPKDGRIRHTLAHILKEQGKTDPSKLEQALIEYKRALPSVTDPAETHLEIAKILEKQGEPELAEEHREMAKIGQPKQSL